MATEQNEPRKPFAIVGQGSIFDGAAYWATLVGIYVMVGGLMFYSGKGKLFDDDGNAPPAIKAQFEHVHRHVPGYRCRLGHNRHPRVRRLRAAARQPALARVPSAS